jgi:hypothetical protein
MVHRSVAMRPQLRTLDYTEEALPLPLDRALVRVVGAHAPPASHVDPLLGAPSIMLEGSAFLADATARALRRVPTARTRASVPPALRRRRTAYVLAMSVLAVSLTSACAAYCVGRWIAPAVRVQLVP